MEYIERALSYLLYSQRGRDAKLLPTSAPFASHPKPTITVSSPDCGAPPATLSVEHTADGAGLIPSLNWSLPESIKPAEVKEYLLVVQDADVPLPTPIMHAAFYHIPASTTSIAPADIEAAVAPDADSVKSNLLKGGFRYAKNLRGVIYVPPRPLRGHGPHRYFYYVVALSEGLGDGMSTPATKDELLQACDGKVLGWGEWIGIAERK